LGGSGSNSGSAGPSDWTLWLSFSARHSRESGNLVMPLLCLQVN
jgi:hypothetical protein